MHNKSVVPSEVGSSFEFYSDYVTKEKALQPDYYREVERILNEQIEVFYTVHKRKPVILDVGSAGIIPYSPDLVESAVILDLFSKPANLDLPDNVFWFVGNILCDTTLNEIAHIWEVDIIIASSLLHHLCNKHNNEILNLQKFMSNLKFFKNVDIYIFESVCPPFLAKLQDLLWPVQHYILNRVIGFTDVRMLSYQEITNTIIQSGLTYEEIDFTQPKYIAQFFIKIPLRFYPLKIVSLRLKNKKELIQ